MAIERSELTWNYKPTDLLELPYESERGEVKLRVANGIAVVILPGTQPDGSEEKELHEWVRLVLTVRALQVTRVFTLDDHPSVIEIDEKGRRHAYLRATAGAVTVAAGQLEFIQTDAFGRIVRDSRKERQEAQKNELSDLSAKALNHPIVGHLLKSFLAALSEPSVEFVRLYEVRTAYLPSTATSKGLDCPLASPRVSGAISGASPTTSPFVRAGTTANIPTRCVPRPPMSARS